MNKKIIELKDYKKDYVYYLNDDYPVEVDGGLEDVIEGVLSEG